MNPYDRQLVKDVLVSRGCRNAGDILSKPELVPEAMEQHLGELNLQQSLGICRICNGLDSPAALMLLETFMFSKRIQILEWMSQRLKLLGSDGAAAW